VSDIVTKDRSESFGLVTEHHHEIGRTMCRESYFCLLVGAECKRNPTFDHRVGYRTLSLHYACIWHSGIILIH